MPETRRLLAVCANGLRQLRCGVERIDRDLSPMSHVRIDCVCDIVHVALSTLCMHEIELTESL